MQKPPQNLLRELFRVRAGKPPDEDYAFVTMFLGALSSMVPGAMWMQALNAGQHALSSIKENKASIFMLERRGLK